MEPTLMFALIGALGIGAQWLAWRTQLPAIVLMLAAGILAGPIFGVMNPSEDFGNLFKPIIGVAVAVILFEGGLTLKFAELRETGQAVRRLVYFGAPLGWLFSTLAIHYGAGLSIEASTVFGGILVVTGPTVIIPLLRQARMAQRPAGILRWEAIVNDPVGALAAVLAFEVIAAVHGSGTLAEAAKHLIIGITVAGLAGWLGGRFVAFAFRRGHVPEFMKVPVLFGVVLAIYASTDLLLHESGLLAVTVMGIVLANSNLPSFEELRRFKEHATIILVSGVFIMLAASLDLALIADLDWRAVLFVGLVIFVARPLAVMLSLTATELPLAERAVIGWIGPRGVVAVAVSGLFGARLVDIGIEDGAALAPLAFAIVAATVVIHGFSIGPVARLAGLTSTRPPGAIVIGSSAWAMDLAGALKEAELPVLVADTNFYRLRRARNASVPYYHGEILSEAAEHTVAMSHYGTIIAATENDAYNALICTDFGPEFGRGNVFQIGRHEAIEGAHDLPTTLGGRTLGSGLSYDVFRSRHAKGWKFVITGLTAEYDYDKFLSERDDVEVIALIRASGAVQFVAAGESFKTGPGDRVLSFGFRETPTANGGS